MHVPSEDEFAAIAAAFTLVRNDVPAAPATTPGWRLAARLGARDWPHLRAVASTSRWKSRGRLDD